jgi:penicillin-binding protein 1B
MTEEKRSVGRRLALVLVIGVLPLAGLWLGFLAIDVEARFGRVYSELPTRVYSRPLRVRPGMDPKRAGLRAHLESADYRQVDARPERPGEFSTADGSWRLWLRGFRDASGLEPARRATLRLGSSGRIETISGEYAGELDLLPIEPAPVGAFYGPDGRDRDPAPLPEMPSHLVDAVLVAEDRRFFEHSGLDLRRIAGAFFANLRAQRVVQGGSTLTQQLVKNVYLTRERSLVRKLHEAVIALLLERMHSKHEILEAYLNEVYLGQNGAVGIHGVSRGARFYFGKSVQDLDLGESALIAGILPGPNLYAPHRRPEAARERRDVVLGLLLDQGKITPEQHREAVDQPLSLTAPPQPLRSHGYFMDWLRADLNERYDERQLEAGSLEVYTPLDTRLQRIAERAVRQGLEQLERDEPSLVREESPLEAALVALTPSGELLAVVGGRDFGRSQFNRATEARRQPGSVFKPVVALAALSRDGLEDPRFTLASVFVDEPIVVPTLEGDWEPTNYDGEFRGEVTLREAVEDSLNIPMTRVGQDLGLQRIIDTARLLGIESRLRPVPSLALGAFEVTLLEMTSAYAVIAAGGRRAPVVTTLAVAERDGAVLETFESESVGVFGSSSGARAAGCAPGDIEGPWPGRPEPPTTTGTPGSSATRRRSWWGSGWGSTTVQASK